jgi:hypothetical protein
MQVAVGETGPAHDVVIRNGGDVALAGVNAVIHGDFAITANRCPRLLPPAGRGQNWCAISVAFRPSATGMRTGDLTVQAAGIRPQVVPLVGGTPLNFPTVQPGATAVEWVELSAGTSAVSGSADGPFAIALQASFDYGSINGTAFASSANTNGGCSPDATECAVYLGVEFLGTATTGSSTGTVTLSNGLTYSLSANVLGPGLTFTPSSIDGNSVPIGSTSDGYTFTLRNVQSAAITLDQPSVSGPFSITNGCGTSLAANATCSMTVFFSPTATGAASGEVQVPTSVGSLGIPLTGTGVDNPADVTIDPATINFELLATGDSATRTVTITNQSAVDSVQIGAVTAIAPGAFLCKDSSYTYCVAVVANNCTTLAPGAACQTQLKWQGLAGQGPLPGALQIGMTPSSATTISNYIVHYTEMVQLSSSLPTTLSVSPSVLQFPATSFGQVSAPLTITVTNLMQSTVTISAPSISDFIIDPSCGPLGTNQSCTLSVRYVPNSGVQQGGGQLIINAYDPDSTSIPSQPIASAAVSVSGFGIPAASVASPSIPPLIQPLDFATMAITNTSTGPLLLYSIAGPGYTTPDVASCSQPIPPGGTCSVALGYSCPLPICSISILSNAQSSPDIYQVLGTQGSQPDAVVLIPNGTNVFPMTAIGASSSTTLAVQLNSFDRFAESLIDFKSNIGSDFAVDNQCPSTLATQLTHGFGFTSTCFVFLTFAPTTPGFHAGSLTLTTNYGLSTILLAGTGAAPPLSVSPASLVFSGAAGQPVTRTLTLTNASTATVNLSSPSLTGDGASYFTIGQTTCGASLSAGAACAIQLTYSNPAIQNAALATLVFSSGINNVVQNVSLTGVVPRLIVTSNQSSFPPTSIGNKRDILFTVTTYQGAPITLQSFALNGTNAADFEIASNTCSAGLVLQGTMSCVIDVVFAPHDLGSLSSTLEIDNTAAVYNASLAGTAAPGSAQVSPATLTFGNEDLLVPSTPQLITLSNPNPAELSLPALPAISGANPADFSVTGICTTIPASGNCQLSVIFNPSVAGARAASLTLGTGTAVDPNTGNPVSTATTVNFAGAGVATGPGAIVNPAGLTFSPQIVGSTSAAQTVTLTNPGQTALSIASVAITAGFQQSNTCGSSVAPGFSCPIAVTFTPTTAGPLSGTLTVTDNAAETTQTVALSGTGASVSISAGSTALSIPAPGGTAGTSINLTSVGGFSGTVSLKCAVAYQGSGTAANPPACTLSPGQVQVSGTARATTTLTITTTGTGMARLPNGLRGSGVAFAAVLLFFLVPRRRRALLVILLSLVALAGVIGCGAGGSLGGSTRNSTTSGSYSVVVTATSEPLSVNTTILLTVR